MKTILFALPGNEPVARLLTQRLGCELGEVTFRRFPDKESYVRIHSDVEGKKVVLICSLNHPDEKLLPLYFLSCTAKDLGAYCTCLVSPYLAYMRQDKAFHEGEGITSNYFARLISHFADSLITVDPHLHRISGLDEIYDIPSKVVHAAPEISHWIKEHVRRPLLIGPDSESEQWVSQVAEDADSAFLILEKTRYGDRDVEISGPDISEYQNHTPVLVDDIISTAQTMIESVGHLKKAGMNAPVCIGVHGVFSGSAYKDLLNAGVARIVTCNTVPHESNAIDLTESYVEFIRKFEKTVT